MIVITWNCRGARGKEFRRSLINYYRSTGDELVALQETRCSGVRARNTIRSLGFYKCFLSEATSFSPGGLASLEQRGYSTRVGGGGLSLIACKSY